MRRLAALLFAIATLPFFTPRAHAGDGARAAPPPRASRLVILEGAPHLVLGAPPAGEARATFVYLHGVCGLTANGCAHFESAPGWLVCPQAPAPCGNGGASWLRSPADETAAIDRALDAARAAWPESARAPVVLVGFSQGAYVAMDAARASPGRYAGLLLLGADTAGGVASLRAAHVARVALACGAYDMMFPKMRATPAALAPSGVSARFASLGAVGHTYVAADGTDDALASLLDWVAPNEEAARAASARRGRALTD